MSKTILLDKFEVYTTLEMFQFVSTQRTYRCKDARLIDITSFDQRMIPELLLIVYPDCSSAEICPQVQEYIDSGRPTIFAQIEKVSNKREKHEICCINGTFFLDGRRFFFNKGFIRAELDKYVPERLTVDY